MSIVKVNIEEVVGMLLEMYNKGLDFVDIEIIKSDDNQRDILRVIGRPQYKTSIEDSPPSATVELNDDNIEKLI